MKHTAMLFIAALTVFAGCKVDEDNIEPNRKGITKITVTLPGTEKLSHELGTDETKPGLKTTWAEGDNFYAYTYARESGLSTPYDGAWFTTTSAGSCVTATVKIPTYIANNKYDWGPGALRVGSEIYALYYGGCSLNEGSSKSGSEIFISRSNPGLYYWNSSVKLDLNAADYIQTGKLADLGKYDVMMAYI